MAEVGNTDLTNFTTDFNAENRASAIRITATEPGTVGSIWVHCHDVDTIGNHSWKTAVYSADGSTLLDESNCRADVPLTAGWVEFVGFAGYHFANAEVLNLVMFASAGSWQAMISSNTGATAYRDNAPVPQLANDGCVTPDIASSLTLAASTEDYAIYLEYTPDSSGSVPITNLLRQQMSN